MLSLMSQTMHVSSHVTQAGWQHYHLWVNCPEVPLDTAPDRDSKVSVGLPTTVAAGFGGLLRGMQGTHCDKVSRTFVLQLLLLLLLLLLCMERMLLKISELQLRQRSPSPCISRPMC